ncbi:MAG TPA: 3-ketoacyl-ACP reductase [Phycisphaerae bacterium]|nr:3-ketoacyl-ACP reductase [Phycisphaerae bacterium]
MTTSPVALVTGGSRGIGRSICIELAKTGYAVLINYNTNLDAAEATRAEIEKAGGTAEICPADIAFAAHRESLLDFTLETFGRIDLVVNNAGIAPPKRLDILETTEENFDRVLDTNLKGPFFLTQQAAQIMINQLAEKKIPRAAIINISSISAYAPSLNRAEYCISKAGLSMMTSLFAARLAEHGIHVYEIRPGIIDTEMVKPVRAKYEKMLANGLTPIRRMGRPEDVARAVAAIAAGHFPFSTGEVFNVDGGFHLRVL